jgi:NADPH:quinone reductase
MASLWHHFKPYRCHERHSALAGDSHDHPVCDLMARMTNPDAGNAATMRAVVIDDFGGPEQLHMRRVPVPSPGRGQVLIRLEAAGVGSWDPFEREGGYAEMQGTSPSFPYLLGSEGAGTIAAVGEGVTSRAVGERVFAASFLNPTGGFYAEYVGVDADLVAPVPAGMGTAQAAVMGGVGMTALRGLQDALDVRSGETLLVHGAGGAMGHLAVQLGSRLGARVFAVASGEDGVALAARLGADQSIDGRAERITGDARRFSADGLDAALLTAGGPAADAAVATVRPGGRAAYPTGVEPEPSATADVEPQPFNGELDAELLERFIALIGDRPLDVHVAREFTLDQVPAAHHALREHHLGKLAIVIG